MKLCQVCYVHTPSCFPTTEGIRKLTCCVCGGILACFEHGENPSLKAKLPGDENSLFSGGASPVPQSLPVSESRCGLLHPPLCTVDLFGFLGPQDANCATRKSDKLVLGVTQKSTSILLPVSLRCTCIQSLSWEFPSNG